MSIEQQRAASRERKAAKIFGTARVIRKSEDKGRRLPDALPFTLADGEVVQLEVKNGMKRCPRVLVKALDQAKRYTPKATPIAIFSDVGGTDIACVAAKDLARWMGVETEKLLPKSVKKKTKRPFKQLELPLIAQQGRDTPSGKSLDLGETRCTLREVRPDAN